MTAPITAVLDANVLYSAPLRDLFIRLALERLYGPHWTEEIHQEWMRSLVRDDVNMTWQKAIRLYGLMLNAIPTAMVTGYESHIASLTLPDPEDRHVLAAAIHCSAPRIVTLNLRDFPDAILQPLGVQAIHPDAFVMGLIDQDVAGVCEAVRAQRQALRNPPKTADELLDLFLKQGLTRSVAALRAFAAKI